MIVYEYMQTKLQVFLCLETRTMNHEIPKLDSMKQSKMFVWPCCNSGKWCFLSSLNVLVHNIVDLITSFNILLEHEIIVVLVNESSPSFAPSCTVCFDFLCKIA